jgi:CheY-like chemotaxis protein
MLKSPDLSPVQQQKYIDIIEKSGKRMLNIIHNLIDISMIESNQADLYLEPEPLNTVLDDLYTFFKPQTDSKGIQLILKKELPNEKSTIDVDKNKLVQVISNLINNAIKFTESGRIVFGYEAHRAIIKFYVHDTGIGIPENMKEIIFKRFQQADYSYSKGFDGSGLGLSISKAFVEMHGGKIWADSVIGEGSSFYFTVPHKSTSIKQLLITEEKEEPHEFSFPKGLTVLVAEDDLTSYLYLEEILKEYSFNILLAQTGVEAIEIVKKNIAVDLILMDIKMPEMNGLNACRIIKSISPKIPVIIQSAYTQPHDKEKATQAGCDEFLTKPLIKKTLINIIAKYVSLMKKT